MIAVAASLTAIGLLQLGIGENVLFADDIQRANTAEFEHCKEIDFVGEECRKFDSRIKVDELDSGQKITVDIGDGVGTSGP
jgi:hypothetical protein